MNKNKTITSIRIDLSDVENIIVNANDFSEDNRFVEMVVNADTTQSQLKLDEKAASDLVFAINKAMWDLGWKRKASDQDEDGEKPIGFRRNERRRK